MEFDYKKSGKIPVFGDWDKANEMPITQYFESARQAGLTRHSSSSGEFDPYLLSGYGAGGYGGGGGDLYSSDYKKPSLRAAINAPTRKKRSQNNQGWGDLKERNGQAKVRDMNGMDYQRQRRPLSQDHLMRKHNATVIVTKNSKNPDAKQPPLRVKPVDEDLYQISPELLRKSERKKRFGFFSRCLVPPCNT